MAGFRGHGRVRQVLRSWNAGFGDFPKVRSKMYLSTMKPNNSTEMLGHFFTNFAVQIIAQTPNLYFSTFFQAFPRLKARPSSHRLPRLAVSWKLVEVRRSPGCPLEVPESLFCAYFHLTQDFLLKIRENPETAQILRSGGSGEVFLS